MNIELFSVKLEAFARAVGAGPAKQIVLVLDGAGWHASPQVRVPEHVHLLFLPPHSPELQPAEHVWPLTNTVLAHRHVASIEELEGARAERCVALQANTMSVDFNGDGSEQAKAELSHRDKRGMRGQGSIQKQGRSVGSSPALSGAYAYCTHPPVWLLALLLHSGWTGKLVPFRLTLVVPEFQAHLSPISEPPESSQPPLG